MNLLKVIVYVTRKRNDMVELLVFDHRGMPEAGVQVPAGTVEDGEAIADAALRELHEESGLDELSPGRLVDQYIWQNPTTQRYHHRHVFHFMGSVDIPDRWTLRPRGEDEEKQDLVFDFRWIPITDAHILAAEQGRSVHMLHSELMKE